MGSKQHYTIPVFIPQKACAFQCIYCNQYTIADTVQIPNPQDVEKKIEQYLASIPPNAFVRLGFFGGSFTGMSIREQNQYLEVAVPYIECGKIDSVQISTRPDYISSEILDNLKKYHVKIIELGAQSLNDDVLFCSGRGHTADDVRRASSMILNHGFELGLQMMAGLPEDDFEKTINTAYEIVSLGAHYTRIYPTLVIQGTHLEQMYLSGNYKPLSLEEAIVWCKELLKIFDRSNVNVLRVGLHPSEGLITGKNLLAGPFHVSFKELVMTSLWGDLLVENIKVAAGDRIIIGVSPKNINCAIGYMAANKKMLLGRFKDVKFYADNNLSGLQHHIKIE